MNELSKTPERLKNRIAVTGACALALALTLAGCKHTVDDATLNKNVQSKISADAALTGQPIQITTANGVVTLNGTVNSNAARTAAGNDVMQVAGVKMVNNSILVQTPPPNPASVQDNFAPNIPAPPPAPRRRAARSRQRRHRLRLRARTRRHLHPSWRMRHHRRRRCHRRHRRSRC